MFSDSNEQGFYAIVGMVVQQQYRLARLEEKSHEEARHSAFVAAITISAAIARVEVDDLSEEALTKVSKAVDNAIAQYVEQRMN